MSSQPISAPFLFCSLSILDHIRACYYFNFPNFRFGSEFIHIFNTSSLGMHTDTAVLPGIVKNLERTVIKWHATQRNRGHTVWLSLTDSHRSSFFQIQAWLYPRLARFFMTAFCQGQLSSGMQHKETAVIHLSFDLGAEKLSVYAPVFFKTITYVKKGF